MDVWKLGEIEDIQEIDTSLQLKLLIHLENAKKIKCIIQLLAVPSQLQT
jgi:ABC-type transporter Mla MlaB component